MCVRESRRCLLFAFSLLCVMRVMRVVCYSLHSAIFFTVRSASSSLFVLLSALRCTVHSDLSKIRYTYNYAGSTLDIERLYRLLVAVSVHLDERDFRIARFELLCYFLEDWSG